MSKGQDRHGPWYGGGAATVGSRCGIVMLSRERNSPVPLTMTVRLAAIVAALCVRLCIAQPSVMDIPGPFGIPVGTAAVEKYSTLLGLDKDQSQLVRTLYQGYRGAYREAVVGSDKDLATADGVDDRQDKMTKAMESLQKFADKTRVLEDQFFEDIKAVLTPEQATRMDRVLMLRRRDVQMRFAFVAGEGVDLLNVLDQLKVQRSAELTTLCGEYETELDRLMIEKMRVMKVSLGKANKIAVNGMPNFTLVGEIIGDLYAIGGRVRDANRQYARQMTPLIPEASQTGFSMEIKKRSFPRVYQPTLAQKSLAMAKGLDDLTPDQAVELRNLAEGLERDLEPLNQRYAAAIESTQERFPKDFMIIMQSRFNPDDKDDPLAKARADRQELDQKTLTRLRGLLKPDQASKLPQYDESMGRMPDFLPNLDSKKDWSAWKEEQGE